MYLSPFTLLWVGGKGRVLLLGFLNTKFVLNKADRKVFFTQVPVHFIFSFPRTNLLWQCTDGTRTRQCYFQVLTNLNTGK